MSRPLSSLRDLTPAIQASTGVRVLSKVWILAKFSESSKAVSLASDN